MLKQTVGWLQSSGIMVSRNGRIYFSCETEIVYPWIADNDIILLLLNYINLVVN